MRKTIVIVALTLIPVGFAHAQVDPGERDALIAFYNATNGPGWTDNTGWLGAEGTECTWYGVTCSGGHVTELYLRYNGMSGSIPASIADLEYLETLHLENNGLSGTVPLEIGDLANLVVLYLYEPSIDGTIPPDLGDLSNLEELLLWGGQFSGSIPPELGGLPKLKRLAIAGTQISGSIPPELGGYTWLLDLLLYGNQLTGPIPPELGSLNRLQNLYLYENQLTGSIPPELGNLVSLHRMYLNTNQLTGSIPPELADPTIMWDLRLSDNQLTGTIPPELGSSQLWHLRLEDNQLSGIIPPELGDMTTLRTLYLNSNMLSGEIPVDLTDLTNIMSIWVDWNALHTDDASVIAVVGSADLDTQTIAPENVTVDSVGDHTAWLSWDAVTYQADPGGYEVFSSPDGSGIWTSGGWTESKTTTTFPVTGLDPGTPYVFAVVTYTDPHADNQNLVNSEFSAEVMDTTAGSGCSQPVIESAGYGPFTLSLTESYDSYTWSTGETTSTIDVDPSFEQWYWVTVTSAGPCEETAAASVAPYTDLVFADGFESGDTTEWSSAVP
jgi:hypothetical protein